MPVRPFLHDFTLVAGCYVGYPGDGPSRLPHCVDISVLHWLALSSAHPLAQRTWATTLGKNTNKAPQDTKFGDPTSMH